MERSYSLIKIVSPYVCPSGLGGNTIFSTANHDRGLFLYVQISLTSEHIICKYFDRWYVGQATKGMKYSNMNISAATYDRSLILFCEDF